MGTTTHQAILGFLNGYKNDAIIDSCENMRKASVRAGIHSEHCMFRYSSRGGDVNVKHQKSLLSLRYIFREWLRVKPENLRVYLDGHGDFENRKMGSFEAQEIAAILAAASMPKVRVVSITGCETARDQGTANTVRLANSISSFAGDLHESLKKHGHRPIVYGRIYTTSVIDAEAASAVYALGKKITNFGENFGHEDIRRPKSKVMFYWEGDVQRRKFVEYAQKE